MSDEPIIGDIDWRWEACEKCKYDDKKRGGCLATSRISTFNKHAHISTFGDHVVCGLYEAVADVEASKE